MKKLQKRMLWLPIASFFLLLASCESVTEINERQRCQLACDDALIANLDRCDAENPEGSVRNECYREVINGFRVCISKCNGS